MKIFIIYIFCFPIVLFAQDITVDIPEVQLEESVLDLYLIGTQQWYIDSLLSKNSNTLSDLLRHCGPVYVKEYGALSTAFFRGLPASSTQVLWNDIPVNSLSTGIVDLGLFPSSIFSNVKLNSGGHSTLSGSGAVCGSIQLKNSFDPYARYNWDMDYSIGSFGLKSQSFYYQVKDSTSSLNLQFSNLNSENDFDYINTGLAENVVEIQEHAYKSSQQYLMNFNHRKDRFSSGFNLWISNNFREVPVGMLSSNPMAIQWDDAVRTKFYWNKYQDNYSLKFTYALVAENFKYKSNTVRSRLQNKHHFSTINLEKTFKNLVTHIGLNFENRSVNSNYYSKPADENLLASFISTKYQINRLTTSASLRQEIHPIYSVPFLYSFGYNLSLNSNLSWKVHIAKNFRAPSFNDLYWVGDGAIGNTELLPEIALNSETSLEFRSTSLSLYSNLVDNMIYWQPNSESIWIPQNLKQVWSRGLELKNDFNKKLAKANLSSQFLYAFTISSIKKSDIENDNSLGKQLAYVPFHKASCITHIAFNKWKFSVVNSFNGKVFTSSDESNELASYFITDLIINHQIQDKPFTFNLKINNLLNKSYQVYRWFPMPGRHLITSLNFKF
ncbi:MAG: TonB-dependent receptor domain-containing protein [Flavobacteriales bacterium]